MRRVHDTQRRPGAPDIRRIRLDMKSRDDIPAIPIGLQDPCGDEGTRKRLFRLPGRLALPGRSRRVGGPGMEPWTIPVPGVVKQGPGCGFDRLRELANQHIQIRRRPKAGPRLMGRGRIRIRIPASGRQRVAPLAGASRRGRKDGRGEGPRVCHYHIPDRLIPFSAPSGPVWPWHGFPRRWGCAGPAMASGFRAGAGASSGGTRRGRRRA